MLPISEIKINDQFENPAEPYGLTFLVVDINKDEKMVKIQALRDGQVFHKPIWKKNTDRMFSESWRVWRLDKVRSVTKC